MVHGTQDIPAMTEKMHEIKTSELKKNCQCTPEEEECDQPYKIYVVCHNLRGTMMLMYIITRRNAEKPYRLSRMIVLSPAGFHEGSTLLFTMAECLILLDWSYSAPILPRLYIPTRFLRMLLNKFARDFQNYPALGGLVQTLMSYVGKGESSNWIGVLAFLRCLTITCMTCLESIHVALHIPQIKRAKKVIMYNYGSTTPTWRHMGHQSCWTWGSPTTSLIFLLIW